MVHPLFRLILFLAATSVLSGCHESPSKTAQQEKLPAPVPAHAAKLPSDKDQAPKPLRSAPKRRDQETVLLSDIHPLTLAGRRSGEGYFSRDGRRMVFQSERKKGNPFYQIYLADLDRGRIRRISPGDGKTTCAWIHPDGNRILYASTHHDPEAVEKQKQELKTRASGKKRRYSWDYDKHYELYHHDLNTGRNHRLTDATGYDAEGSYSPDGRLIVFASNRHAYQTPPTGEAKKRFELNRSSEMDLYLMNADGPNLRRLTRSPGYDGGPFFSADGKKICWRRFSSNGATAEIFTMDVDGTGEKQITRLGHMSWAPYFHPSGDYLIFSSNKHGFGNFELFIVDAEGRRDPVRVTHQNGFDGLPVFLPDGHHLSWTSQRTGRGSQIVMARWNDAKARSLLKLPPDPDSKPPKRPTVDYARHKKHLEYLASEALEGRLTGTPGEKLATAYMARHFEKLGLKPAGDDGGYFQNFSFTSGVRLGEKIRLALGEKTFTPRTEWVPVSFTKNVTLKNLPVVFAGYGIVAPKTMGFEGYDSYVHLDVKDKWVMVFRAGPTRSKKKLQQALRPFEPLVRKAMTARDKGAAGLIFVSGPNPQFAKRPLVPVQMVGSLGRTSIGAVSVTDAVAETMLRRHGDASLRSLYEKLDRGEQVMGFELKNVRLTGRLRMDRKKSSGRNVLGLLQTGDQPARQLVVVGAHIDHLGRSSVGSRAKADNVGRIHRGADDNASGSATLLELAADLAGAKERGQISTRRDVLLAAWSGEELGLIGSTRFATEAIGPEAKGKPRIVAYLNMDMVGRYRRRVAVQGIGSSDAWVGLVEQANLPIGLNIKLSADSYLPTDTTPFYTRGVPILASFTGVHDQYHTPRDTPDLIDYPNMVRIGRFMTGVTRLLLERKTPLTYRKQKRPKVARGALRVFLGTVPDYTEADVPGMKLSGVVKGGPAEKAGLRAGDIITSLGGQKVENIYDYMRAIGKLKIGKPAEVKLLRDGQSKTLTIKPGARS